MSESDSTSSVASGTEACPDCSGTVSVRAFACPHCGAPLKQPAGMYDDPENPGQKRYWDGNAWAPPRPPGRGWNVSVVIAGIMAIGFLPGMFLAAFFATDGGGANVLLAIIASYGVVQTLFAFSGLLDIRYSREHSLVLGIVALILGALLALFGCAVLFT